MESIGKAGIRISQERGGWRTCAALFVALCVLLVGCQREWHLTVLDASKSAAPVLCVSTGRACQGDGVAYNTFSISRYGEEGEELEEMWTLKPVRNVPIKVLTYGVVPDGWREIHPSRPLREGSWYAINALHFFKMERTDEGVSSEVRSLAEFFREAPTPSKQ